MKTILKDNHLTYFKVQNFKCFDSIELRDVGFINIILGDNNVGKTSLLEALTFENNIRTFNENLIDLLMDKDLFPSKNLSADFVQELNAFKYFLNKKRTDEEMIFLFKLVGFEQADLYTKIRVYKNQVSYHQNPNTSGNAHTFRGGEIVTHDTNYDNTESSDILPFMGANSNHIELVDFYEETIQGRPTVKAKFLEDLTFFISDILDIEIKLSKEEFTFPYLIASLKNIEEAIPIQMFGNGSLKFFKIIMALNVAKNRRLMIDEIDNGFHYSRLKSVLRTTLQSAISNSTQLFITTHSSECLKFFKEVL